MKTPNNPVGRLVRLFDEAHKIENVGSKPAVTVWNQLLGVRSGDRPALHRRFGQVLRLLAQAEAVVKSLPDIDHEIYLTWVPRVQGVLSSLNLAGNFAPFIQQIDDPTLSVLRICDDQVRKHRSEPVADEDSLGNLLKEVRELRQEIAAATDLDDYLRDYMLHHLDLIEQAIGDYRIMGIEGLGRAFQASIGAVVTERATFRQAAKSSKGDAFLKVVAVFVLMNTGFRDTVSLPGEIKDLLTIDKPKQLLEPRTDPVASELSSVVEESGQETGRAPRSC